MIESLIVVALIVQVIAWLAPAPILAPMVASLGIGMGQFGLIISVIALCIAIFSFLGGLLVERFGTLRTFLVGIWLLAVSEVASGFTVGYGELVLCRLLEGVGYGLMVAPPAALVMEWFTERERPYVNTVNVIVANLGALALFAATPHLYHAVGSSWQRTLACYGASAVVVALLWTFLGRERASDVASKDPAVSPVPTNNVYEVIRMRGVLLASIALFGTMWVSQLYTSFLPEFFREYRGLTLEQASTLTGVLPLAGMFAGGLGGLATGLVGLRRPFLWPLAVLAFIGFFIATLRPDLREISAGLALVGIGGSGGLAALVTLVMELPSMTPSKMGTAFAIISTATYAAAFISPIVGGTLVPLLGLRGVLIAALSFQLLPIISMYLLPETGPGRRAVAISAPIATD